MQKKILLHHGDILRSVIGFVWCKCQVNLVNLGYTLHRETRSVYQRLIDRKRSVRIYKIDESGLPWIQCRWQLKNGTWQYHSLAVNHDGWIRVVRNKRSQI